MSAGLEIEVFVLDRFLFGGGEMSRSKDPSGIPVLTSEIEQVGRL